MNHTSVKGVGPSTIQARFFPMIKPLLLLLAATSVAHAKLEVVATTPDLGAIAHVIGLDRIEVNTLAKPTEDAHFVEPKPSFVRKLNQADVLIEGGAELEIGWLPPLLQQARNPKINAGATAHVRACEGLTLLEVPTSLDRSAGDIHALGNPHFLTDPVNALVVATNLAAAFARADPAGADAYRANLARFTGELSARIADWQKQLAPFKGRHLVAYHNSWPYFARRFGLETDLFLEPKPGVGPSPAHLAATIGKMKELAVRTIIVDPYLNRRTAEIVASKTGATVVDVAQFPGGIPGTEAGYIALMDRLVRNLATAMSEPARP